jgi:exosortase A-associated hydrolase 1
MSYAERPLIFDCEGEHLVGVLASPETPAPVGVIIIVGGPQYRAGSHRQFVRLARRLAAEGFAVLRFDYRGMGDASGGALTFEECAPDIAAAVDALLAHCPDVERVVLWGLCDAASAALMYVRDRRDARIAGLVLLNPWARSEATLSKTHLKHYYGKRLTERDFWVKLFSGGMHAGAALRDFARNLRRAAMRPRQEKTNAPITFQDRMLDGWRSFRGPTLLVLSDADLTAKEFLEYAQSSPSWRGLLQRPDVERCDIAGADHTFSAASWSKAVETQTLQWLRGSVRAGRR